MCKEKDREISTRQAWIAFFVETNAELRSRRVAEYTYTAASIAAFGAFAWGVAALGAALGTRDVRLPVVVAVLAILGLVFAVLWKIVIEHEHHNRLQSDIVHLAGIIADSDIDVNKLPEDFQQFVPGTGHLWSAFVLKAGGLGAIIFCISIGFSWVVTTIIGIIGLIAFYCSHRWMKERSGRIRERAPAQQSAPPDRQ